MRFLKGIFVLVALGGYSDIAKAASTSLKQFLEQGFEIKDVAIVPAEIATRTANKIQADGAVITLQKGPALAVCNYTFNAYVNVEWNIDCRQGN